MCSGAELPPNIVLILVDDLGYGELGCQGNTQIPTPHIDSIAQRGVRFTSGYVTSSYCSPSRAGLLTGIYQSRFGYDINPVGARNEMPGVGLPLEQTTLAEALHDAGYTAGLIGKWHLGATAPFHPLRQGFDEFFGFLHEGHFYVPPPYRDATTMLRRKTLPDGSQGVWMSADGQMIYSTHMGRDEPAYDANNPILRAGQPVVEQEHLTDALTREAVDFIERHKDRPFFLYLSYNAVHSPLQADQDYLERMDHIADPHRRIFAAMLAQLDAGVGAVLNKLRQDNLEDRTLVFFLSDNGGPTQELTSSNHPLRGGKGNLYEGGIRVPFLMQWPGTLPAGRVYQHPVSSLDIFATAIAVAGSKQPSTGLDGTNLLPYATGQIESAPHESLFWRMPRQAALRSGPWKLVHGRAAGQPRWELYNLAEDPAEQHDLASAHPMKLQQLREHWGRLNRQMEQLVP